MLLKDIVLRAVISMTMTKTPLILIPTASV